MFQIMFQKGLWILGIILFCRVGFCQDWIKLPAIIHIASTVSDGEHSLSEIVKIAKDNGIKVVVINDRDLMRWEYGIWPLRNLIKKRVEINSIFKYGIKRYLNEIRMLQNKFSDLIIIPGTESAPFYYWEGSPFRRNLKMYNWHKHILTVGLEKDEDYRNLPVIGNFKGLRDGLAIIKLWPFLTLLVGFVCMKKRIYSYKDYQGKELAPYSKKWRITGVFIIILSFLFVLNNWPFLKFKFDSYHGDLGSFPYQNFINYVEKKGGLTFWAHPEAEYILNLKFGKVSFETRAHPHLLLETKNYTGFSIFYEGYKIVGKPGGVWDKILTGYCKGEREKPIWAIAGLAFDNKGDLAAAIRKLQTIILVPYLTKEAVLNSLRKGRVYVKKGKDSFDFSLIDFSVSDGLGKKGIIGDTVKVETRPLIHLQGQFLNNQQRVEIKVIKEGKVIKDYKEVETPFNLSFYGEAPVSKTYYRVEIKSKGIHLVTNPIFVY